MNIHEIIHAWEKGKLPNNLDALMANHEKVEKYKQEAENWENVSSYSTVKLMYQAEIVLYRQISIGIQQEIDKLIPEPQMEGGTS